MLRGIDVRRCDWYTPITQLFRISLRRFQVRSSMFFQLPNVHHNSVTIIFQFVQVRNTYFFYIMKLTEHSPLFVSINVTAMFTVLYSLFLPSATIPCLINRKPFHETAFTSLTSSTFDFIIDLCFEMSDMRKTK